MKKLLPPLLLSLFTLSCSKIQTTPAVDLKPSVWKGHTTDRNKTDTLVFTIEHIDSVTGEFSGVEEDGLTMISSGVVKGKISGRKLEYVSHKTYDDGIGKYEKVTGRITGDTFIGKYQVYTRDGKKFSTGKKGSGKGTVNFKLASYEAREVAKAKANWTKETKREKQTFVKLVEEHKKAYQKQLVEYNKAMAQKKKQSKPSRSYSSNSGGQTTYQPSRSYRSVSSGRGTEYVLLRKVMDSDSKAIIQRRNGEQHLIEYGVGVISIWRYEGKSVLINSRSIFGGVGATLILPDGKTARIWDCELIN